MKGRHGCGHVGQIQYGTMTTTTKSSIIIASSSSQRTRGKRRTRVDRQKLMSCAKLRIFQSSMRDSVIRRNRCNASRCQVNTDIDRKIIECRVRNGFADQSRELLSRSECASLPISISLRRRRRLPLTVAKASNDGEEKKTGEKEEEEKEKEKPQAQLEVKLSQRVFELLTLYGGITGTAAVFLGLVFNINPLENLRFVADGPAMASIVLTGVLCGLPVYFTDTALMAPNYVQMAIEKLPVIDKYSPQMTDEASTNTAEQKNKKEVIKEKDSENIDVYMLRLTQMSNELATYLSDLQVNKIRNNPGAEVSRGSEYLIILCGHLAEEMLQRGVILFGLQGYILFLIRERIWDYGIDEVDIESLFRNVDFLQIFGNINNLAGLASLTLMCITSILINTSRLYVASRQHNGIDVDTQMVPNVYYYKLAPLIWSRMSSEQRNAVRKIVGEDVKKDLSSSDASEVGIFQKKFDDATSSTNNDTSEDLTNESGDGSEDSNLKSVPIKLVGNPNDSNDIVIKILNENKSPSSSSSSSGSDDSSSSSSINTGSNERENDLKQQQTSATMESNLKQLIQSLQEDKPSPKVYKELIRMCDTIMKHDRGGGVVSKILKQGRETTWKLQQTRILVEAFRDILELICFGTSALLTRNLLASYSGSVVADVLFSFFQRLGGGQKRTSDYDYWKAQYTVEGTEQMLKETMKKLSEEIDQAMEEKGGADVTLMETIDEPQKQPN